RSRPRRRSPRRRSPDRQLVTSAGLVPAYRLPGPGAVLAAGADLTARGELWLHIAISVQRVLLGFAIGSVIGLAVAAIVGLSRAGGRKSTRLDSSHVKIS